MMTERDIKDAIDIAEGEEEITTAIKFMYVYTKSGVDSPDDIPIQEWIDTYGFSGRTLYKYVRELRTLQTPKK